MSVKGIIFASDREVKLNELTIHRTTTSLPYGSRYRLIDFALSNFVNSGVTSVGIIARKNYESLMDHIRMGRDWDLNRKNAGIAVFPPLSFGSGEISKGKVDSLYGIMSYLVNAKEDYVYLTNGNLAINVNINDVVAKFEKTNADIVVMAHETIPSTSRRVVLEVDDSDKVNDILISEGYTSIRQLVSLGAYLIKRDLLISLVQSAYQRNQMDFEKDILQRKVGSLQMYAYIVDCAYVIDDIKSYYNASMQLLNDEVRDELFYSNGRIYTKVKDSAPTIYKEGAEVSNSLIADGCVIGGKVTNSILFRGVVVEEGAEIVDSIVMEKGRISRGAKLSHVITDKQVHVAEDRVLSGTETYPIVVAKGKQV